MTTLMRDRSWLFLLLLLGLSAAQGLIMTGGVHYPPDLDAWRDIGLTQAILDGNWFGDPAYPGELRHYPPLVPALLAALVQLVQPDDLLVFWVRAGVWIGLIPVVMFFVLARAMLGQRPAAVGTALFVLLNSAVTPPWISGGYSPWLLTPILAQAFFFGTVWLIHARAAQGGWLSACAIGAAIGTTFLAHAVPGLLLTGILGITVVVTRGLHSNTVAWLAVAGVCLVVVAAPYVALLALSYPAGIIHFPPGEYTEPLLRPNRQAFVPMLLLNMPLLVGLLLIWVWKAWPDRTITAILGAWIFICALALVRHYACAALNPTARSCAALRVPVHHYHMYIQIAAPLVLALAFAQARKLRRWAQTIVSIYFILGALLFFFRPYDVVARNETIGSQANPFGRSLDLYRWIRVGAPSDVVYVAFPDAPLVTGNDFEGSEMNFNIAPFLVMAAAKSLLVANTFFSNPYVDWDVRHRERNAILNWIIGDSPLPVGTPCRRTLAILPPGTDVAPGRASLLWQGEYYSVFQTDRADCLPS
ncbi:hypothetical protein AAFN86_00055 [Roseomonas sp. CAU 1739]|uniref:hypothetical protein n=1 Tax=Roseomonas sp. CAU 1739 TaxID=3140364 RepID=UPI00325BEC68